MRVNQKLIFGTYSENVKFNFFPEVSSLLKHIRTTFICAALCALLFGILLAGCSSGSSTTTAAPAAQQQSGQQGQQVQQTQQNGQGQPPAGQGPADMTQIIAKAAAILGVSESDLSAAWEDAMQELGPGVPGGGTPPSGGPPSGQPPEGERPEGGHSGQQPPQGEGGQAPPGPFDMMAGVYAGVAEALNLTTEAVQSAFEQARSELSQ